MREEIKSIIVAYIKETLNPVYGISREALELLELLMMSDDGLQKELLKTYEHMTTTTNKVFFSLPPDHDEIELYEKLVQKHEALMKAKGITREP
jgi:hypothetical protein